MGIIAVAVMGCSFEPNQAQPVSLVNYQSDTPYATIAELDAITNLGNEYVYWRVARAFALVEIEGFRVDNGWEDAELSLTPVLIYDAKSRPKYYEFRVILGGVEAGTVTAVAQKKDGGPVQYVLRYAPDYTQPAALKGISGSKVVANGYPSVCYGAASQPGGAVYRTMDADGGETEGELDPAELALEHPEYFTNDGMDTSDIIETVTSNIQVNLDLWEFTQQYFTNLVDLSTNDDVVKEMMDTGQTKAKPLNDGRVVQNFFLWNEDSWWNPEYNLHKLSWKNSQYVYNYEDKIWCGPSAVATVAMYYNDYEKLKVKIQTNTITNDHHISTNLMSTNLALCIYSNFITGVGSVSYEFTVYHDLQNKAYISNLSVSNIDLKTQLVSTQLTTLSNGVKIKISMFGSYSTAKFSISARLYFLDPMERTADIIIKKPNTIFTETKRVGYDIKITYTTTQDGYYNLGKVMGITDWNNGGSWDVDKGIKWVTDDRVGCNIWGGTQNKEATFVVMKNSIEKDNPFFIARSKWVKVGNFDPKEDAGHWRVGIGYRITSYNVTCYQWLNILWFKILINKWTETRYQNWMLLTDGNGAEAGYYPNPLDPAQNEASLTMRSYLNHYLFWEKYMDWGYSITRCCFPYKK
ncbi:MAG: hypothetical protein HPY53_08215 [Brevinematales bacterium]|nr:hypothetical protein [Brevinematales bacterium]